MAEIDKSKFGEFGFDPFIIDTRVWLDSVRAYLEEMETAIPQARIRADQRISEAAKEQNWDDEVLQLEADIIESRFETELPKLLRYSVVVLLHTIVESELLRLANYLREMNKYPFKVSDFKGSFLDKTKLYFDKVANLKISDDSAWEALIDLSDLRDIIVHRGGRQGIDSKQQTTVKRLIRNYKDKISLIGASDNSESTIEISTNFCQHFLNVIETFFERLFTACELK